MNALICSLNSSTVEECLGKLISLPKDILALLKKEKRDDRFGDNLLIALTQV